MKQGLLITRTSTVSNQGAFMLLASLILALIALATMAITTISRHYHERAQRQKSVDEIALMAARDLPMTSLIQQKIQRYLSMFALNPVSIRQEISPSRVALTLTFSDEFAAPIGRAQNNRTQFTYSLSALAIANPQRVSIFLDTSSYTAPPIIERDSGSGLRFAEEPWGNRLENSTAPDAWRASRLLLDHPGQPSFHYWRYTTARERPGVGIPAPSTSSYFEDTFPRLLTQQCFNPTLQAMKEAAVRLYDTIAIARSTSIGIATGPVLTRAAGVPLSADIVAIRSLLPASPDYQSRRGAFIYGTSRLSSNALCLAVAEHSQHAEDRRFALPPRSASLPALPSSSESHGPLATSESFTIDAEQYRDFSLSSSSVAQMSVREAIWSLAATRDYDANLAPNEYQINASAVLESVRHHLLSSLPSPSEGGASFYPSYTAYLLMGDLPWENGERLIRHAKSNLSCSSSGAPWSCWRNHTSAITERALEQGLLDLDSLAEQVGIPHAVIYYVYPKHPGNYWQRVGSKGYGRGTPRAPPLLPFDDHADRAYLCLDEGAEGGVPDCEQFIRESEYFANRVKSINARLRRIEMVVVRVADTQRLPYSFSALAPLQSRSVVLAQ